MPTIDQPTKSTASKLFTDDYSAGGACVELNADANLPQRFEMLHGATRKKCRMVWKRGRRIGLCF
ncbi:hypothetical protein [Rhodopseudomonas parapalustris]